MSTQLSLTYTPREPAESGDGEILEDGKFRCNPYNKTFDYKRSFQRHLRENKRHLPEEEDSGRRFKCLQCHVTCARQFDLRRHQAEKHGNNGTTCTSCGHTGDNIDTQHQCEMRQLTRNAIDPVRAMAVKTVNLPDVLYSRLDPKYKLNDSARILYFEYLEKDYTTVTCGHCHMPFERRRKKLLRHLTAHIQELAKEHMCEPCGIGFTRVQDLVYHRQCASLGDCGFSFPHGTVPCTGHHPPSCANQNEFCQRLREWEQSELQYFRISVQLLARTYYTTRLPFISEVHPTHAVNEYRTTAGSRKLQTVKLQPLPRFSSPAGGMTSYCRKVRGRPIVSTPCNISYHAKIEKVPQLIENMALPDADGPHPISNETDGAKAFTDAFYKALASNDGEAACLLVSCCDKYREKDPAGWCLLQLLADGTNPLDKAFLPEYSVNNELSKELCEALLLGAVRQKRSDAALYLLTHGTDPNYSDAFGNTPISLAVGHRDHDMVRALLKHGANVRLQTKAQRIALAIAALNTNMGLARLLIADEANPHYFLQHGQSVLRLAVEEGDSKLVSELIEKGVDINQSTPGLSPLVRAVQRRNGDITRILIQGGADVNLHNPLYEAARNQDLDIVKELTSHGADPNYVGPGRMWTPLLCAVRANNYTLVRHLVMSGANINQRDNYGRTPLHVALHEKPVDVDVVRELVSLGADVDAVDPCDDTPLALICAHDRSLAILLTEGTGCELTVYPNTLHKLEGAGFCGGMTSKQAREILRSNTEIARRD